MKQLLKSMSVAACVLALHIPVSAADDRGTAAEATALVQRAAEYLKANGPAKSYAAFNDTAGQFKDRDLYVFVMDMNGKMLSHGANAKLIGKDLTALKDSDDKLFIKTMLDVAKSKGKGWVRLQMAASGHQGDRTEIDLCRKGGRPDRRLRHLQTIKRVVRIPAAAGCP